jgi:hypothetical protein
MKQVNMINVSELDDLVEKTYHKHYDFQQQAGCKERGVESYTLPIEDPEDYKRESIPEVINGDTMGVSFKAWLDRDPKQLLKDEKENNSWTVDLFWERNFYPHPEIILNDLHTRGLLPAGELVIDIDW